MSYTLWPLKLDTHTQIRKRWPCNSRSWKHGAVKKMKKQSSVIWIDKAFFTDASRGGGGKRGGKKAICRWDRLLRCTNKSRFVRAHLTLTVFVLSSRFKYVPQSRVHMLLFVFISFCFHPLYSRGSGHTHTHTHSELGAGASQKMKQVSFQRQMKKGFVVLISHFVYFTAIKKQVCKYALLLYRRPAPFPSPALLLF